MAEPFQRGGTWYARVKDASGRWRNVTAADVELRKVPRRAPAFLEPHEVARLLAEVGDADRALVATALYAGLRKGELFGLRKADVDLARRLLTVRRSYASRPRSEPAGKP